MADRIAIVQGHPDPRGHHYLHALADAYSEGAREGNREVRVVDVAQLAFPLLRTKEDYEAGALAEPLRQAQETLAWCGHLAIFYPLWLGTMPALLKGFFEQVLRPGFAYASTEKGRMMRGLLSGRSARIVITMGMPAFFYRWYFRAHSLKSLERNVLKFCGIAPIRESLIGMVEAEDSAKRHAWLAYMRQLGRAGR